MWISERGPTPTSGSAPATPERPQRRRARRFRRGRVLAVVLLAVAGAVGVVGILVPPANRLAMEQPEAAAQPVAPTTPAAEVTPTPTPSATPSRPPAPVLRLTDRVPATGPGSFTYATGRGEVLGRAGTLRRYRVAVERNVDEHMQEFATKVDAALADPRSWIGSGRLRLQRVPDKSGHDFTVYLVTAGTAREMCAASGVDIRVGGKPYTSCRGTGRVIINLDRWMQSVPHYVSAKVPLDRYRTYVVNHEVGHELGHGHERCPRDGRPAPVMMQQTLFLKGCVANPWPYLDGERYAGPSL
ncbi:DUF3152 domain-containing protein [Plantactinospora endophytica]|uniref:DUF3152 domain-containing protein n=1 Tax=Plantactinospora endophytica TaxID=673535 RepID=A0ABQ4E4Y0_9ACTN|nr:DUF3152 domain-containing protein [Plantactinospora endophytica]GIG89758.1 hypothetical protein Pen02_46940 [Plantactinospora endophytica]